MEVRKRNLLLSRKSGNFCLAVVLFACLLPQQSGAFGQAGKMFPRLDTGGHTSAIKGLAFLDDERLVSVGFDKVVRIRNIRSEASTVLRYPIGDEAAGQAYAVAVSPVMTSPLLAVGIEPTMMGGNLLLFDLRQGERAVPEHYQAGNGAVTCLAFSPTEEGLLASGCADGTIRLWRHEAKSSAVRNAANRTTGASVRPAPSDTPIRDWKTERLWTRRDGDLPDYISGLAFSPDGKRLAAASWQRFADGAGKGTVSVWDLQTGKSAVRPFASSREVTCLAWTKMEGGESLLAYGSRDGVIRLWNPVRDETPVPLETQKDAIACLTFSPDGKFLLSGSGIEGIDPSIRVWRRQTGDSHGWTPLPERPLHETTLFALAVSPDGKRAASGDALGHLKVWDIETREVYGPFQRTDRSAFSLAWSEDGRFIAWGTDYRKSLLMQNDLENAFDLAAAVPARFDASKRWLRTASGQNALSGQQKYRLHRPPDESMVIVRDRNDREWCRIVAAPGDRIKCALLRGESLIVGSEQALIVWDIIRKGHPRKRAVLSGHESAILALALNREERFLASAGADQTIRFWDMQEVLPAPSAAPGGSGTTLQPKQPQGRTVLTPVLSLFGGEKWAVWTRQGYFNAAPGGDDVIGFHFNPPDRTRAVDFRTAYQCRDLFWKPEQVPAVLGLPGLKSPLPSAASALSLEKAIASAPVLVEVAPIGLTPGPDGVYEIDSEQAELRYTVAGARPGTDLKAEFSPRPRPARPEVARGGGRPEVARGGGRPEVARAGGPQITGTVRTPRLAAGQDTALSLLVTDGKQQSAPVTIRVRFGKKKPEEALPRLFVLAVGISAYKDARLGPLSGGSDAVAIASLFEEQNQKFGGRARSQKLFESISVTSLVEGQATKQAIFAALDRLKKESGLRPQDYVVLFLAGHGQYYPYDDKTREAARRSSAADTYFFLPSDADMDNLPGTAVDWRKLAEALAGLEATNQILFVDHCFSGGVSRVLEQAARSGGSPAPESGDLSPTKKRPEENAQNANTVQRALFDRNLMVFTASAPEEFSYEYTADEQTRNWWRDGKGHGYFTLALLEALSGTGAGAERAIDAQTERKKILLDWAAPYLRSRVFRLSAGKQHSGYLPGLYPESAVTQPER